MSDRKGMINVYTACEEDYEWKPVSMDEIAMNLVAGERIYIEPFGEVLLIMDDSGMPSVVFTLKNAFIHEVINHQVVKLKNLQHQLAGEEDATSLTGGKMTDKWIETWNKTVKPQEGNEQPESDDN